MNAQQMQDFVDALIAAAAAATTAANRTAAAAVPPVVPFALLPGAANIAPLDWAKTESMKLFTKAVDSIDNKFSMIEDTLRTFIEQVRERSRIFNWNALLTFNDDSGTARNFLDHYGMFSIATCRAHANNHVGVPAGSAAGTPMASTRMAQDSMMLFQFLMNSLTDPAKLAILADKEQYHVNGHPSGVCFLKIIIGRSSIDTNAKISMLRKRIARLPEAMRSDFKGNVREFNTYVAEQRDQLLGRGQEVSELITHLFDAYLNGVDDEEFHRYIESYQNQYDDGAVISSEKLMKCALTKYDTIVQRKEQSGEGEKRVMALQAETKESKEEKEERIIKALMATIEANYAASNTKKGEKKFVKKIPEWKKNAPAAGDPQTITKTVNDKKKTFHWCPHHQMWTIHTPKECTFRKDGGGSSNKNAAERNEEPKLALNKALLAFLEQDIDE